MRQYLLFGSSLALALLSACDSGPAPKTEQAAQPATPADPIARMNALSEAQQLERAAAATFRDERSKQVSVGEETYALTPQRVLWSGDRPILVSGGQGEDCHACSGTLALHYLRVDGDRFTLDTAYPDAALGTSFGGPPEWRVREDLAAVPVIEAQRGGTFQGYTCTRAQLVALGADAPVSIANDLPIGYSDAGAVTDGAAETVEGTIEAGIKDREFAVTYAGSMTGRTTYRRVGALFKPVGKPAAIPEC